MRAIASGMSLQMRSDFDYFVYWNIEDILNCPFEHLFEPLPALRMFSGRPPLSIMHSSRKNLFLPGIYRFLAGVEYYGEQEFGAFSLTESFVNDLLEKESVHAVAYFRFAGTREPYRHFVPRPFLQDRVEREVRRFDVFTVGVHVRRTDNVEAIHVSPMPAFMERMEQEIAIEPRTNFYVASDSSEVKLALIDRFGDRVLTSGVDARRDRATGMEQAVVELYALSRTRKLLGSHNSSFSHTAAEISGIEEVVVRAGDHADLGMVVG
ncbi:MAG: hypothetical protein H6597_07955 [Flavobacteriales bacterium]|nr:hypothetical protein [Flavobacteriales bacterium]